MLTISAHNQGWKLNIWGDVENPTVENGHLQPERQACIASSVACPLQLLHYQLRVAHAVYNRRTLDAACRLTQEEATFTFRMIPEHQKNGYSHWIGLQLTKGAYAQLSSQHQGHASNADAIRLSFYRWSS